MDPRKAMFVCQEPREYRATNLRDIEVSKEDKRRGGGPRVGPFQENIPGTSWEALPKYDYTTRNRSSAFNERMHVEWENHVDHILARGGELPVASVVAKAGFRSCAPCCRDMLALARPTGKAFIMVDLAEDDERGTFHFVVGDEYLPVPKEACNPLEVAALKKVVAAAQVGHYGSGRDLYEAVVGVGAPVDEAAQAFYMGDKALMPSGCAMHLKGTALLQVLHAEHFARLVAEYGASIMRDAVRPAKQKDAVLQCRVRAKRTLMDAWAPHLAGWGIDLEAYAAAAVAPLLPEDPSDYVQSRRSLRVQRHVGSLAPRLTAARLQAVNENEQSPELPLKVPHRWTGAARRHRSRDARSACSGVSTAAPDDAASAWSDPSETEEEPL